MASSKYIELTEKTQVIVRDDEEVTLYQIRAVQDMPWQTTRFRRVRPVKKGDLGGWVESLDNVQDKAWVDGRAMVHGDAVVSGMAYVGGYAVVCDWARVGERAEVSGNAKVCDWGKVFGEAKVRGESAVRDYALVNGYALVEESYCLAMSAEVGGQVSLDRESRYAIADLVTNRLTEKAVQKAIKRYLYSPDYY